MTTRISDEFSRNFLQDTVAPPSDKDKAEGKGQAKGATGPGATPSVTLDSSQQPTTTSSTGAPPPLVPPPTTNPNFIMVQVQTLQTKMSSNQMKSSSDRNQVDQDKMKQSVKTYNHRIKQEEKEKKKAHHKGLISKIVDIVEDTVEITAGAALCFVPGGQIAGAALLATGIINTTDQALTGQLGGKAVLKGKDADIMNYCSMGATVAIGVATCGAGLLASGASDAVEAGVQVAKVATEAAVDAGTMSEEAAQTVVDAATTAAKAAAKAGESISGAVLTSIEDSTQALVDAGDITEDTADSVNDAAKAADKAAKAAAAAQASDSDESVDDGDSGIGSSSSSDIEMDEMNSDSSNVDEMEEKFEEGFDQDVVEDSGSSSDGDGGSERELAVKGMKIGVRAFKGIVGLVNAAGGITEGANTIEIGYMTKKADDYAADATKAEEGIGLDNMDMQSVLGTLQNQIQQYQTISSDLTSLISSYAEVQTDTSQQGYA